MSLAKEVLKSLEHTYCQLKPSPTHGIGVFAIKTIPKGINPFNQIGPQKWAKLSVSRLEHLGKEVMKMINDFYVIEKDGTVLINEGGLNSIDISFFVNDSKSPNMTRTGRGDFVASREIRAGKN